MGNKNSNFLFAHLVTPQMYCTVSITKRTHVMLFYIVLQLAEIVSGSTFQLLKNTLHPKMLDSSFITFTEQTVLIASETNY